LKSTGTLESSKLTNTEKSSLGFIYIGRDAAKSRTVKLNKKCISSVSTRIYLAKQIVE